MIIGLVGLIGSGKGTVADHLVLNHKFIKISFADSLKDAVSIIFGWQRYLLEGDTNESRIWRETIDIYWTKELGYDVTPRLILQLMGTEAGRNIFGEDIWISSTMKKIHSDKNYVIADTRFSNEIDNITSRNGHIIQIDNGRIVDWYDTALLENLSEQENHMKTLWSEIHESEYKWIGNEKIEFTITNDTTIENLNKKIDIIMETLNEI